MYEFAANKIKLQRAIVLAGKDATEDHVKAEYIKMNGLVVDIAPAEIVEEAPVVEKKTKKKK